jgi:type III secretion protein U
VSVFASSAAALVVGAALTPLAVVALASRVEARLREAIDVAARGGSAGRGELVRGAWDLVALSSPVLGALAAAALAATLAQTGGFVGFKRLAPRLERLNLVAGVGALVSRARVFGAVRALAAAAIVGAVVVRTLLAHAGDFARTAGRLEYAAPAAAWTASAVVWQVVGAVAVMAAIDVAVVRLDRRRRLRMSRNEVARERKEIEGDPVFEGDRARAREELIAHGSPRDVRAAIVVLVDAEEATLAYALRWAPERGDRAPIVVTWGHGELAAKITRAAVEHGVKLVAQAAVVNALAAVRAGDEISESLYEEVAAILRELAPPNA